MNILLAYFSGTGSTAYVADKFEEELTRSGNRVRKISIGRGHYSEENEPDLLILVYAVYAGNPPGPVVRWIGNLPPVAKIPAAVISVSGGGEVTPNLACRIWAKRLLRRRGFSVFFEDMIVMPSNWITSTKPVLVDSLLEELPRRVSRYSDEILGGERKLKGAGPLNRFISFLSRAELVGSRFFGRHIRVGEECNGCGLCERNCPVGNIVLEGGSPRFGSGCTLCLSCLYGCPRRALTPGWGKGLLVPEGFSFQKLLDGHKPPGEFDLEKETRGFLWLGVRRYLRKSS